jgi:hypothetical protein
MTINNGCLVRLDADWWRLFGAVLHSQLSNEHSICTLKISWWLLLQMRFVAGTRSFHAGTFVDKSLQSPRTMSLHCPCAIYSIQ